jgi:DNA replication and repair protein RecF
MPSLQKISIRQLRNISAIDLFPGPGINILYGENGSGKTSILEGIHLLGLARSFRNSQLKPLIQHGQSESTIFGRLDNGQTLGLSKSQKGTGEIKVGGKNAESASFLAQQLPLQLFNSDTFRILEGSPANRRNFIDWGVFHVEHRFLHDWRQAQKSLQQRNSLLKHGASDAELAPWTLEFCRFSERVDTYRRDYLSALLPHVEKVVGALLPDVSLDFRYERGWDSKAPALQEVLEACIDRDRRYGHTHQGPQRADLSIMVAGHNAADTLSRGQQKLVVCSLKIAQGIMLQAERQVSCLYLIDDLPSELDARNRARLCEFLTGLGSQVFITCVEPESLDSGWPDTEEMRLFHVKHGKIAE